MSVLALSTTFHEDCQSIQRRKSGLQGHIKPFTIVEDPSAWTADSVKDSKEWIYTLEENDLTEIDNALYLVGDLDIWKEV